MRRTRRPTVVWLPISTEGSAIVSSASTLIGAGSVAVTGPAGTIVTQTTPVTIDFPAAAFANPSLSDTEGSAYRLRRIVGKLWCGVEAVEFTNEPPAIVFYAGFIVLRVDQNGAPLGGANSNNYNPGLLDSESDPWIWRRSWLLGNRITAAPVLTNFPGFNTAPGGNWEYGSVSDGPHIDAKTARVISDEERLFLVTSATALGGNQGEALAYSWLADLRVLASMRKMSGNRRNASR